MSSTNKYNLPAYPPPAGVTAQIGHAPNGNTTTVAIITLCLALTSIAVALRVYSRFFVLCKVQLQDYLMLLSFTIYIAFLGIYLRLVHYPGWFVHLWDLTWGEFIEFLRLGIISTSVFLAFYVAIKTAILLEWLSLFLPDGGDRRSLFYWSCHIILWANVLFCTSELILVNLACTPIEYSWDRTIEGYCRIETGKTSLSAAVFAFVTDVIIFFIPQRIIWTLNMTWRRKLGVSVVFALGLAACTASIVRLYYTVQRNVSYDLSYHLSRVQLTAVGEGAAALLVFCIPAAPKAVAAIKQSQLVLPLPSWSSLVSVIRRRASQGSLDSKSPDAGSSPFAPSGEKHKVSSDRWQAGSGSVEPSGTLGAITQRRV
ncbi:hypothetical protein NUW58_g9327 [Xylaria curta]|uniref:Uncharacterized protein n=1 Tax=Xylaria curta TaxID=42375 RepID=A0ACC1MYR0_9PEZI|nr:hypothetical protein NUW58_g9327 [Xylaria curta]